jgi:peptidoglycan/LPS O-acetylase OafA/YrhL
LNLRAFWIRRALRIWPLYFAVVIAAFGAGAYSKLWILPRDYFVPFLCFGANWAYALHGLRESIIGPLWSVSIEEQFYVVWPVVLTVVKPQRVRIAACALLAVAIGARIWLAAIGADHIATWFNTFARLDPIAAGILLAAAPPRFALRPRAVWTAAAIAACIAVQYWWPFLTAPPWTRVLSYLIVALSCAAILEAVRGIVPRRDALTRSLIYGGKISYGLYVYHHAAITFANLYLRGFYIKLAAEFAMTVALAIASYELFESPFLKFKRRFTVIESREV